MTRLAVTSLAALVALHLYAGPAAAQLTTTFVSEARGDNANPCTFAAPCRSFQAAHDHTLSDGQITVLDPGTYGAVTITKSISIVNDGVGEASIPVSGGLIGISVNAPAGGGYVNIRGITVQGIGFGGGEGLRFNSGFSLTISNCVFRNLTQDGVLLFPSNDALVSVLDTLMNDNGRFGIEILNTAGSKLKVTLTRIEAAHNSSGGVFVSGEKAGSVVSATVADSVIAGNINQGLFARSLGGGTANLMVLNSVASYNSTGIVADGTNATVRIGQSGITGNTSRSWDNSAGSAKVLSYGDNYIDGNPAPPSIARK